MEHLILHFGHGIQDIIPYSEFIQTIRPLLAQGQLGEYLGDDMAIDGGDAEAIFAGKDARALYVFLTPYLRKLRFLQGAQVRLIFGPLDGDSEVEEFVLMDPA